MSISLPTLPVAGLLIEIASGVLTVLLGFTGFFGGAAHYAAIFARLPRQKVELMTGVGFFLGATFGGVLLLFEALS
jgi:hypothetical protein